MLHLRAGVAWRRASAPCCHQRLRCSTHSSCAARPRLSRHQHTMQHSSCCCSSSNGTDSEHDQQQHGQTNGTSDATAAVEELPQHLWQYMADSHCHPQLDAQNVHVTGQLHASHVAAMCVAHDVDWGHMAELASSARSKVIPGYGIHPWWAHLHASQNHKTWDTILDAKAPEDVPDAIDALRAAADSATEPNRPQPLRIVPLAEWRVALEAALKLNPTAIVGEVGLDRAATIPGTDRRVSTSFEHQLELLREQLAVAAAVGRPVSMHCVRAQGHMLEVFKGLAPEEVPPAVMMHSFSGAPEEVKRFCSLPGGVGSRFYFSFSAAINGRSPSHKLVARIRAVPDDRLLIESDQVTPLEVDAGLVASVHAVAAAKGWSLEDAARQTHANFKSFYAQQLQQLEAKD